MNFPNVELPPTQGAHRILNVHENVPGVLRDVNRIVSDARANVQAQVLATHGTVGYLLVDLDKPVADEVCARMRELETTLRARSLS